MAPSVEKLPIPPMILGEGPHWDVGTQSLYLVDIVNSVIARYDPSSNKSYCAKLDIPLASFIIPVEGAKGRFVVASRISVYLVDWDGCSDTISSAELLFKLPNDLETNRINDGKCDPSGRLWFGTMSADVNVEFTARDGKLYSFSKQEGVREFQTGIGISNGLAWSSDGKAMYYIDSLKQTVDAFNYNPDGRIENRRVVFDFKKNNMSCFPDGMTIDGEGNLWVACFEGNQVLHIDPRSGKLLDKVGLPTPQITSAAWGGPELAELYVTSASHPKGDRHPEGGYTFRVSGLRSSGLPMANFKCN